MPRLANQEICCGCSACAAKCNKEAIIMQPDNGGFLIPKIDPDKCVECGACETACPALSVKNEKTELINAYLFQHYDEEIRRQSTSGGAFTALAQTVISKGGIVFGAIMTEDNIVKHDYVSTVEDLFKFRNSKYVQSIIGDSFKKVKEFLKDGSLVCFSGTPCQISGLLLYLGKKYDNLITVDVVCHAIPSPLIFKKYVELSKKRHPDAQKLVFRDKKRGYSYSTMAWYDKNGKEVYRASYELDEWYRLFLHDKCDRSSCYDCKYQNQHRLSDITIWDCYNAHELCPSIDDNKGTTNVIAWSAKGNTLVIEAKNYSRIISLDRNLTYSATINHKRNRPEWNERTFYSDAKNMDVEAFFYKYVPRNFKSKLSSFLRLCLWKIGLHDYVRRIVHNRRNN